MNWSDAIAGVALGLSIATVILTYYFNRRLEQFRYELDLRSQASKVAEYVSWAEGYKMNPEMDFNYIRANQLAFELLLVLPDEAYFDLRDALHPSKAGSSNTFKAMIKVREHMLGGTTKITDEDVFFHMPPKKPA